MFNLPWYAWLNVFALPCLWLYLMLEYALQGKPKWFRQYTTAALFACACTVFFYWNPHVNTLFTPLQLSLIVIITPMVVWTVGVSCVQMLACAWMCVSAEQSDQEKSPASLQTCTAVALDDDDVDLDGGTNPTANSQEVGKAVSSLFSSDATLDDSIKGITTLFGAGEDKDDAPQLLVLPLLVQFVGISAVLIPPMMMSFELI